MLITEDDVNSFKIADITPSWALMLPSLIRQAQYGVTRESKMEARDQLIRMSKVADKAIHFKIELDKKV